MSTELLLKVEGPPGQISLDAFLQMMKNAYKIIDALDAQMSDGPKSTRVYVNSLGTGSLTSVVRLEPRRDDIEPGLLDAIPRALIRGFRMLETGERLPPSFTERNVERVRRLSAQIGRDGATGFTAEIVGTTDTVTLTKQASEHVVALSAPQFKALGSVVGRLDMISARSGNRFGLSDALYHRPVICSIPEDAVERVKAAFKSRVLVSGIVHRNSIGQPVRVENPELRLLPTEDELPTLGQFYGSDPGFTGTYSVSEYVQELRG